jgi:hypothetical protein
MYVHGARERSADCKGRGALIDAGCPGHHGTSSDPSKAAVGYFKRKQKHTDTEDIESWLVALLHRACTPGRLAMVES